MIRLNNIPDPVLWHEGMLLAPQHFQQAWHRGEELQGYLIGATAPYPWGVRVLEIDTSILADDLFRIRKLEALLPDGLAVFYDAEQGDDPPLQLNLADCADQLRSGNRVIHLSVPRRGAVGAKGRVPRWRQIEGEALADDFSSTDRKIAVDCLRPMLELHLSSSATVPPRADWVSLPLARLVQGEATIALDPHYDPPRLTLAGDNKLATVLRKVVIHAREKAALMAERLRQADDVEDLRDKLRSIAPALLKLDAVVRAEAIHPFHAYLALCEMAGTVAWFGPQPLPQIDPAHGYRHDDALPAFEFLEGLITASLDRHRDPFRRVGFERDATRFSLVLDPTWLPPDGQPLVLGVRIGSAQTPASVKTWLENAVIASAQHVEAIGQRRFRGAQRKLVSHDTRLGLSPAGDMLLCHVYCEGDLILPGKLLVLTNPAGAEADDMPEDMALYLPAAEAEASEGKR